MRFAQEARLFWLSVATKTFVDDCIIEVAWRTEPNWSVLGKGVWENRMGLFSEKCQEMKWYCELKYMKSLNIPKEVSGFGELCVSVLRRRGANPSNKWGYSYSLCFMINKRPRNNKLDDF